eukprot:scaffold721_cov327-Prasinococcus_capsulatus_cf.AAC.4
MTFGDESRLGVSQRARGPQRAAGREGVAASVVIRPIVAFEPHLPACASSQSPALRVGEAREGETRQVSERFMLCARNDA